MYVSCESLLGTCTVPAKAPLHLSPSSCHLTRPFCQLQGPGGRQFFSHPYPQLFLHPGEKQRRRSSSSIAASFLCVSGKSSTASAGDMGEDPSEGKDRQGWLCEIALLCTPIKACLCSEIFLAKEQKLVMKEKNHCSDHFKETPLLPLLHGSRLLMKTNSLTQIEPECCSKQCNLDLGSAPALFPTQECSQSECY